MGHLGEPRGANQRQVAVDVGNRLHPQGEVADRWQLQHHQAANGGRQVGVGTGSTRILHLDQPIEHGAEGDFGNQTRQRTSDLDHPIARIQHAVERRDRLQPSGVQTDVRLADHGFFPAGQKRTMNSS